MLENCKGILFVVRWAPSPLRLTGKLRLVLDEVGRIRMEAAAYLEIRTQHLVCDLDRVLQYFVKL